MVIHGLVCQTILKNEGRFPNAAILSFSVRPVFLEFLNEDLLNSLFIAMSAKIHKLIEQVGIFTWL